jgi:hypothetical protein
MFIPLGTSIAMDSAEASVVRSGGDSLGVRDRIDSNRDRLGFGRFQRTISCDRRWS